MRKLKAEDLVGNTYNALKILSYHSTDDLNRDMYLCQCECNNHVVRHGVGVKTGRYISCGCRAGTTDLTGRRYGKLTIIGGCNGNRYGRWQVACDCGTKFNVDGSRLRLGNVTSCGCSKRQGKEDTGYESTRMDLSRAEQVVTNKVRGMILQSYRNRAKLKIESLTFIPTERYYYLENGLETFKNKELDVTLSFFGKARYDFDNLVSKIKPAVLDHVLANGMDTSMSMEDLIDSFFYNTIRRAMA
jgi:hypothetical protein